MPISIIRQPPSEENFIPLASFQSSTPSSFSNPVLHHRQQKCLLVVSREHAERLPVFESTSEKAESEEVKLEGVDVWVTSQNLIIFNVPKSVGAEIPYFSMSLHALQRQGPFLAVYMQLALNPTASDTSNDNDYDDDEFVELIISPLTESDDEQNRAANALFQALSDCASLHPDPWSPNGGSEADVDEIVWENDDDGPRFEGFPGEGIWVTAENAHQFQFDNSESIGASMTLGPGAGSVRMRENDGEGHRVKAEEQEVETKWRRTS